MKASRQRGLLACSTLVFHLLLITLPLYSTFCWLMRPCILPFVDWRHLVFPLCGYIGARSPLYCEAFFSSCFPPFYARLLKEFASRQNLDTVLLLLPSISIWFEINFDVCMIPVRFTVPKIQTDPDWIGAAPVQRKRNEMIWFFVPRRSGLRGVSVSNFRFFRQLWGVLELSVQIDFNRRQRSVPCDRQEKDWKLSIFLWAKKRWGFRMRPYATF